MSQDKVSSVAVIGAGTSGIVAAKYLVASGVSNVRVFEKHDTLGGVFVHGVWAGAEMVSSKYTTSFSDFTMDEWWASTTHTEAQAAGATSCPNHLSTANYARYLEAYARHFGVFDLIEFGVTVEDVHDRGTKGYDVTVVSKKEQTQVPVKEIMNVQGVLVCSGLHQTPRIPECWQPFLGTPAADTPHPTVIHSQEFKSKQQIPQGGRVLIVGGGETAHDIAAQVVEGGAGEVFMSLGSDGYLAVPKEMFGKDHPLDVVIANAFEHYGEQKWVKSSHLRWRCMTPIIRIGFALGSGSTGGLNQLAGHKKKVERGRHFIMKTGKALPYINRPVALRHWSKGYPWRWLFPLGDKGIETLPTIDSVTQAAADAAGGEDAANTAPVTCTYGVAKKDGGNDIRTQEFDRVILCTGYSPSFPFLREGPHWPPTKRNIASPDRYSTRLGFIGFVRPNVGAIPPMSELQVMWWVHFHILSNAKSAVDASRAIGDLPPARYTLLDLKKAIVEYGSDFGSYMFQAGEDMGACPDLWQLVKDRELRILILAVFGQSYTQLFRIHGPFASEKCRATARNMVDKTIWHRGLGPNLILFSMTMIFGFINIVLHLVEYLLNCVMGARSVLTGGSTPRKTQ